MDITTSPIIACREAWTKCETLLHLLIHKKTSFSERTTSVLQECADICMGTFHALQSNWPQLHSLALLTIGICEECAEICERYEGSLFADCAAKCRECSSMMTPIALTEG